jgi:response regulator RpfG family c-di-GMP phosphodiesterase
VLLNLKMPKMEGLEILQKIRDNQKTSSVPVFILISHKSEEKLVRESHLRVEGFIQKPLTLKRLKKAVNKIDFSLDLGKPTQ